MAYNLFSLLKDVLTQNREELPDTFDGYVDDEPETSQAIITSLNKALKDICRANKWNFRERLGSFSTVVSTQEYDRPNGVIDKMRVEGNTTDMVEVDYDDIWGCTDSEEPNKFAFYNNKLCLYPIPDDVYSIGYKYFTTHCAKGTEGTDKLELEEESDYPIIPETAKEILVAMACVQYTKKPTKAQYVHWEEEYYNLLSKFGKTIAYSTSNSTHFNTGIDCNW